MTINVQQVSSKVVHYDAVMYDPEHADELRLAGWVDELDMGFGRNNAGMVLRGWIKDGGVATIVFPGDFVLRHETQGRVSRIRMDPRLLAANFDIDFALDVEPSATPASDTEAGSLDPSYDSPPIAAAHQPDALDPSGADVQTINKTSAFITRATGEQSVAGGSPETEHAPPEGLADDDIDEGLDPTFTDEDLVEEEPTV